MEKYFSFNGVATRSEYWAVMIIATLLAFVVGLVGGLISSAGSTAFGIILLLVAIVGGSWLTLSACVRRCRDAGINVWWTLGACVPYVGWIVAIVIGCLKTDEQSA